MLPLLLLLCSCDCAATSSAPVPDIAGAESTVREFFGALQARDCAVLLPMLAMPWSEGDCEEYVEDMQRRGVTLEEVESADVDGRDSNAAIVRTRISDRGRSNPMLFRVEFDERWRIRF